MIANFSHTINNNLDVKETDINDLDFILQNEWNSWIENYIAPEYGVTQKIIESVLGGDHAEQKRKEYQNILCKGSDIQALYVLMNDNQRIGSVAPFIDEKTGRSRLGTICVLPDYRQHGGGNLLFDAAINWHSAENNIWVHCISFNKRAVDWYTKKGFNIDSESEVTSPKFPEGSRLPIYRMVMNR